MPERSLKLPNGTIHIIHVNELSEEEMNFSEIIWGSEFRTIVKTDDHVPRSQLFSHV
jgi:hypothetical protein